MFAVWLEELLVAMLSCAFAGFMNDSIVPIHVALLDIQVGASLKLSHSSAVICVKADVRGCDDGCTSSDTGRLYAATKHSAR